MRTISDVEHFYLIMGHPAEYELLALSEDDIREESATAREEGDNITDEDIESAIRGLAKLKRASL